MKFCVFVYDVVCFEEDYLVMFVINKDFYMVVVCVGKNFYFIVGYGCLLDEGCCILYMYFEFICDSVKGCSLGFEYFIMIDVIEWCDVEVVDWLVYEYIVLFYDCFFEFLCVKYQDDFELEF